MSGATPINTLRSGSRVLEALSRPARTQRRWLSSTQSRQNTRIISFNDAPPYLKPGLDEVREKIILPTYLPRNQQERIYRKSYEPILERDPYVLEIDGEVHKFYYRDKIAGGLPNTNKAVKDILDKMQTKADFQLLPRLLQGVCVQAGRKLDPAVYPKAVRRAAQAGALPVILDCVSRAKATGFQLKQHETIAELLTQIQWQAIESGWDEAATQTALRRTQQVLDLLESDPEHQWRNIPGKLEVHYKFPFHRDPQFLAARLNLAAAMVLKHKAGPDMEKKVLHYAEQLVKLWPAGSTMLDLHPTEAYRFKETGVKYLLARSIYLWHASPILYGLKQAAQVVGASSAATAQELLQRANAMEPEVEAAVADVGGKGRGIDVYDRLFSEQKNEYVSTA
ncbi:hypothetical protein QBC47DRAFT_391083 [Echria macrotheca]|uniref:Uncharacterized protein n=1 Tax=Echria macrotheca TaxID=438768 RepID=A0AAJ0B7Y1_9PEZI|nr:hypothetical protein QBC47DRAFT_391083 [Echria macrotheca]